MARNMRSDRCHTPDLQPRPTAQSWLNRLSLPVQKTSSGVQSSSTWTSTTGDLSNLTDTDELGDRDEFVQEYNRLAKKYGIRPLVPDASGNLEASGILQKRNWWSRTFRRTSSQSTENSLRRPRSTSHVMSHLAHPKRDSLRDQDLQGLVRLCGKSFLYLPPDYTPGSLLLPTCFRSTAQYLVRHAPGTRGVFRIPGSVRVVNELYEFYCVGQPGDVASTVRSPNLPAHINAGIHDVASCFKKFLAGLPGGILGSLSLFDAMCAINSQLCGDPEFSRTKQNKLRARLIALAVSTLRSQFRRELICAVFGLLCLLGRSAEIAPREDELGQPLPTSDLMGYNALSICFGPLLVGDMLNSCTVKLSDPSTGLYITPNSPSSSKSQKGSQKGKWKSKEDLNQPQYKDVDKVHIVNNITEMLVTNWRDVARQMRSLDADLGIPRTRSRSTITESKHAYFTSFGRISESEPFAHSRSKGYGEDHSRVFERSCEMEPGFYEKYPMDEPTVYGRYTEDESRLRCRGRHTRDEDEPRLYGRYPEDEPRSHGRRADDRHGSPAASVNRDVSFRQIDSTNDAISVKRTRPTSVWNASSMRVSPGQLGALSPPREQSPSEDHDVHPALRVSTPLKSSLKSSHSKPCSDLPVSKGGETDEGAPRRNDSVTPPPPPRSPKQLASGTSPFRKHFEAMGPQPRQQLSSSVYSSDTHQLELEQFRSGPSPTPTRTHRLDYDHYGHKAPFKRDRTHKCKDEYNRQRSSPTRSEAYDRDYEQPRARPTQTRSETYSPEHSQAETSGAGHIKVQLRRTLSPAGRLATTWKLGYDCPRSQSSRSSGEVFKQRASHEIDYAGNECSNRRTSVSSTTEDQRAMFPRDLTQVDGLPNRNSQQATAALDPMIAFQSGPGINIPKAPSATQSLPRISHVDSEITPAKLPSTVGRASAQGSADSAVLAHHEPVKESNSGSNPEKATPRQMDGVADFVSLVPTPRESFIDLRGEFGKRGVRDSQASPLPVCKSRAQPRTVVNKKTGQGKKASWTSLHRSSPKSTLTGRRGVRPCASKVMGLAAMFDTAAKASLFVPTPGGTVPKEQKRSETATIVSPYTSNPSPRASAQSLTSVSTPISLMSPAKLSIHLSTPAGSSGKKSMIPRLQNPSATYSTGKKQRHISPTSVVQGYAQGHSVTAACTPCRILTPSRIPVKKKVSTDESPSLPQLDGVGSTKHSVLRLTAQQEIHPVSYYSSPIPQSRPSGYGPSGDGKRILGLSQHCNSSRYSDEGSHSRESSSLSPSLNGIRSASSLRDQIRNLRTEISSKNEDCAHLRLELEESRKAKERNAILLREDLERAKTDVQRWRHRAEKAEKKVDKYELLAMQIKNARDRGGSHDYHHERQGNTADAYIFKSGSDYLTILERVPSQPLTARMNQSVRRTPPAGTNGTNSVGTADSFSECSSSTVVRTHAGLDENGPVSGGGGLWAAVDELVDFASPGLWNDA